MKYMAIIDADEKPVSCEFIGCKGNVAPYLIGATTNIRPLEQQSSYNSIKTELKSCEDCVSREAVIDHICESKECYKYECKGRIYKRCYDLQWIYDLPSVTPHTSESEVSNEQR